MERRNTQEHFADQPSRTDEYKQSGQYRSMQVPVVTQNMPENGKRITPAAAGEAPTQQQIEQDVTATNPSIESMESRG